VFSRRLWRRYLGVFVSRSRSSSFGIYIEVVTELDHDSELAGQLAHMNRHYDVRRGSRNHNFPLQRRRRQSERRTRAIAVFKPPSVFIWRNS
jgi:hypothetical protein